MGVLGAETPKTIMRILNKPLIEYHIQNMNNAGIVDFLIVIGANGNRIMDLLGTGERFGIKIQYVEQKQRLGIAHALGMLEPYVDSPFILVLGDIYFVADDLQHMIDKFYSENLHGLLSTKIDTLANIKRNFTVIEDDNGFVKKVIEKPKYIENNVKGCGLYMFSPQIFEAIRKTPRTALRDEYEITTAIQIFISDGHKIKRIDNIAEDLNLTYPFDLLEINLKELARYKNGQTLLGQNVAIKDTAKLQSCVIGDNVSIKEDIFIKNCLIFSNTTITDVKDLQNMIITPSQRIDCTEILNKK